MTYPETFPAEYASLCEFAKNKMGFEVGIYHGRTHEEKCIIKIEWGYLTIRFINENSSWDVDVGLQGDAVMYPIDMVIHSLDENAELYRLVPSSEAASFLLRHASILSDELGFKRNSFLETMEKVRVRRGEVIMKKWRDQKAEDI